MPVQQYSSSQKTSWRPSPGMSSLIVGLTLGLTYLGLVAVYGEIAALQNIRDARALQVSKLHGISLLLCTLCCVFVSTRPVGESVTTNFVAASVGVALSTFVVSIALLVLANSGSVLVTPPVAWLILSAAGGIAAVAGWKQQRVCCPWREGSVR